MDQFCDRCQAMEGYSPDDHDCAGNLRKQATEAVKGISSEASWDSLTLDGLLEIEMKLKKAHEGLDAITKWWKAEAQRAELGRDQAYQKARTVRGSLNEARAELRTRFDQID